MRRLHSLLLAALAFALFSFPQAWADDPVAPAPTAPAEAPSGPSAPLSADTGPGPSAITETPVTVTSPAAELSVQDAVILGLVEGITEFLPVSSTGHLIIATSALGLEDEHPLLDAKGQPLWYKKPTATKDGELLTLKLAADTFTVVIQFGAILAVIFLYWGQLMGILRGLTGQNAAGVRLLRNIILGFLPAAIIGLGTHHWIDAHLFSVRAVIVAQVSGAVLMWAAERWRRQNASSVGAPRLEPSDLTPKQSLGIGLMQCLALWPGTSRSMVTMVGGYFTGLSPAKAAEFSFLVGLPTLAGATALKSYSSGAAMIAVFGWPHVLLGTIVAAISATIAVKFLVSYLGRHGLGVFAVYRILLAIALGFWFFR